MMHRLKLVEQLNAQLPNVFRVLLLVSKASCKTARPYQQLPRRSVVMMRFLARERVTSDVIQQSLAHAHSGNAKRSQVQVAPQGDQRERGNSHHVRSVSPHPIPAAASISIPAMLGRIALLVPLVLDESLRGGSVWSSAARCPRAIARFVPRCDLSEW